MRKLLVLLIAFVLGLSIPSCTASPASQPSPAAPAAITVASKIDTEGALLSQVIILMLRANNFQVTDRSQLGGTQVVRQALLAAEIDIYPEYTGNGAFFFSGTDPAIWKDARRGYEEVKKLDLAANNIVWLQPAPANNTWAIAVPKALAEREKLQTLDDFAAYVNRGGYVKLIGSAEFVTSPVALPAFQKAYGFTLKQEQLVTLSGGNTAVTEKAAADGTDGVNAAMAYGTDGSLSALGLVVLADPRGAQPVYEPAPIVRGAVYNQYPQLAAILDPVFKSLTLETLQSLNAAIASEGKQPADVARGYLTSKGFLK